MQIHQSLQDSNSLPRDSEPLNLAFQPDEYDMLKLLLATSHGPLGRVFNVINVVNVINAALATDRG